MDSLNLGNFQNIYGNQGGLRLQQQSCNGNHRDYDDIDFLSDSNLSINNDTKSRIFIGPNSDDDDRYKFFMVCAENKINALIERVREFSDSFERPEVFENEAVSMAIQQHGLRKSDSQNISSDYDIECLNSSNIKSASGIDVETPTTSNSKLSAIDEGDDKKSSKMTEHDGCLDVQSNCVLKGFDVDDMYFLNEAVAAAIEQKGLCSSTFVSLK